MIGWLGHGSNCSCRTLHGKSPCDLRLRLGGGMNYDGEQREVKNVGNNTNAISTKEMTDEFTEFMMWVV